ncbi:MAG: hypothetical protein IT450_18765 [Phycisphaerales bacterium]|nr:hypothetical protein [Phycisphaerales bacterium]
MRVRFRTILGVLVSSLLAGSVLAGIDQAPVAHPLICNPAGRPAQHTPPFIISDRTASAAPVVSVTLCGDAFSPWIRLGSAAAAARRTELAAALADAFAADEPAVVPLPPGPGSAALVACGLALLSAVGGLRSLRKAHFGTLPEWYSTSGPRQIGHATPLDLESPAFLERAFETVDPAVTLDSAEPIDVDLSPHLAYIAPTRPRGPPTHA